MPRSLLLLLTLALVSAACRDRNPEPDPFVMEIRTWLLFNRIDLNYGFRADTILPEAGGGLEYVPENQWGGNWERNRARALLHIDSIGAHIDLTMPIDSTFPIDTADRPYHSMARIVARKTFGDSADPISRTYLELCDVIGCSYHLFQEGAGVIGLWPWHGPPQFLMSVVRISGSRSDTTFIVLSEEDLDIEQYMPPPPPMEPPLPPVPESRPPSWPAPLPAFLLWS